jgi:hypothetical protein
VNSCLHEPQDAIDKGSHRPATNENMLQPHEPNTLSGTTTDSSPIVLLHLAEHKDIGATLCPQDFVELEWFSKFLEAVQLYEDAYRLRRIILFCDSTRDGFNSYSRHRRVLRLMKNATTVPRYSDIAFLLKGASANLGDSFAVDCLLQSYRGSMCKAVGDNDFAKRHCEDALEYFVKVEKKMEHRHREEQLKRYDEVVLNNFVAAQTSDDNETVQDDNALPRYHLRTQMVLFANAELLLDGDSDITLSPSIHLLHRRWESLFHAKSSSKLFFWCAQALADCASDANAQSTSDCWQMLSKLWPISDMRHIVFCHLWYRIQLESKDSQGALWKDHYGLFSCEWSFRCGCDFALSRTEALAILATVITGVASQSRIGDTTTADILQMAKKAALDLSEPSDRSSGRAYLDTYLARAREKHNPHVRASSSVFLRSSLREIVERHLHPHLSEAAARAVGFWDQ